MVHITEYRIVLPLSVEEYRRGQRYANWKTNEANTSEGQGGQLLASTPYVDERWGTGFYQHSLYRLGDRLPDWVLRLVPKNALVIDEKSWICYPWSRSIMTIPFFNKLSIEVISMHRADDCGTVENIHGLSQEELNIRKVDLIDIAMDKVPKRDYKPEADPQLVTSKKTGRGPLSQGWQSRAEPVMCAYKLVKAEANYWGVQSRVERLMVDGIRQVFLLTHRNAFALIDEWYNIPYDKVLAMELEGRRRLARQKQPPVVDPKTGKEVQLAADGDGMIVLPNEETTDGSPNSSGKEGNRAEEAVGASAMAIRGNTPKSPRLVAESDGSDIDAEFFEAEMEWEAHEQEERIGAAAVASLKALAPSHSPFTGTVMLGLPPHQMMALQQSLPPLDSCAVCAIEGSSNTRAEAVCLTCGEVFCDKCFHQMHKTVRLKAHLRREIKAPIHGQVVGQLPSSLQLTGGDPEIGAKDQTVSAVYGDNRLQFHQSLTEGVDGQVPPTAKELSSTSANEEALSAPLEAHEVEGLVLALPSQSVWDSAYYGSAGEVAQFEPVKRQAGQSHGWRGRGHTVVLNQSPEDVDRGCLPLGSSSKVDALPASPSLSQAGSGSLPSGVEAWAADLSKRPNELSEELVKLMATIFVRQAQATSSQVLPSRSSSSRMSPLSGSPRGSFTLPSTPSSAASTHARLSQTQQQQQQQRQQQSRGSPSSSPTPSISHTPSGSLTLDPLDPALPPGTNSPQSGHQPLVQTPFRAGPPALPVDSPALPLGRSPRYSLVGNVTPVSSEAVGFRFSQILARAERSPSPSNSQHNSLSGASPRASMYRGMGADWLPGGSSGEMQAGADPYGVHVDDQSAMTSVAAPYAGMLEVEWVSGGREILFGDAGAISLFRTLIAHLRTIDPKSLPHECRLAFWLNIFNALVMHAYLVFGIQGKSNKRPSLLNKAAYIIGGMCFSAVHIELSILRARSYGMSQGGLFSIQRYRPGDQRLLCALDRPEPLVTFALCCGARSAPALQVYTAKGVQRELETAARNFCQAAVGFSTSIEQVVVPSLIKWYAKDFSRDSASLLEWISMHVAKEQQAVIQGLLSRRLHGSRAMQVVPYDWTFRYLISPACLCISTPIAQMHGSDELT